MKYSRFEDLPVWQAGTNLALKVYALTENHAFSAPGDLRDQLRRAALSVPNNIAEGFERGSTAELLVYLYIARGSAGEVRSMLLFCQQWPRTANLKSQISDLLGMSESCSRQLRAWADNLQNSDITGQRHLNENSRKAYVSKHRADAFMKRIEQMHRENLSKAHPTETQDPG